MWSRPRRSTLPLRSGAWPICWPPWVKACDRFCMALCVEAIRPERVAATLTEFLYAASTGLPLASPVIDWTSFAGTTDFYPTVTSHWFAKPPWEDPTPYWKRSPLSLVGNVTTPTMVVVGEEDYRTPVSQSDDIKVRSTFSPEPAKRNWERRPGVIAWEQTIPAGESARFSADYQITYPKDARITGLR